MNQDNRDFVAYIEQSAQLMNLPISGEHLPGVVDNLENIAALASLVQSFPLPETIEAVPIFEP